ncbi:hypothetical protein H2203_007548 [Taxawa tesnikishii (nom. ined.)]|nr:hypothetical protein H2203_007548 [Dothideales sp. JES 119]
MTVRGERVQLNLDGDGVDSEASTAGRSVFSFVSDIQERAPSAPTAPAPAPPTPKKTPGGFPTHRKRVGASRFKQSRTDSTDPSQNEPTAVPTPPVPAPLPRVTSNGPVSRVDDEDRFMAAERRRIDEENKQKLAAMSPEEIEEERRELLQNLGPSLLERLLRRANIDEGREEQNADFPGLSHEQPDPERRVAKAQKSVRFAAESPIEQTAKDTPAKDKDGMEPAPHVTRYSRVQGKEGLADEEEQHDHTEPHNHTDPHNPLPDTSDIRFAFTGALIPPTLAAEIPVTAGLHHHGDAPDAAGYTVAELAMLARSTVPAQRCVAFQTLGRILYRLGRGSLEIRGWRRGHGGRRGYFGGAGQGLWKEVEKEGVIELCVAESEGKGIAGAGM